jgi:hypothetical protein
MSKIDPRCIVQRKKYRYTVDNCPNNELESLPVGMIYNSYHEAFIKLNLVCGLCPLNATRSSNGGVKTE